MNSLLGHGYVGQAGNYINWIVSVIGAMVGGLVGGMGDGGVISNFTAVKHELFARSWLQSL